VICSWSFFFFQQEKKMQALSTFFYIVNAKIKNKIIKDEIENKCFYN
jgi:hypothetical protein